MKKHPCDLCCKGPCPCPLIGATKEEKEVKFPPKPLFRFIRVLEYVGDEEWIKECLKHRSIKHIYKAPKGEIRELALNKYEEVPNGK